MRLLNTLESINIQYPACSYPLAHREGLLSDELIIYYYLHSISIVLFPGPILLSDCEICPKLYFPSSLMLRFGAAAVKELVGI